MISEKGLLEAYAGSTLRLYICDQLSDSQWSLMLQIADEHNVELEISMPEGIHIPDGIHVKEAPGKPRQRIPSPNRFLISDDVDYSVRALQTQNPGAKVIDLSEMIIR